MQKLSLLFLTLILMSCSWHLRGSSDATSTTVSALALNADNVYTPLYRTFKNEYENRRIDLSNTNGQPQLKLLSEKVSARILSLNTELDPAEDETRLLIHYQITLPNQPTKIYDLQLFRTFTENKNAAAARDNEQQKLIDEMRRDAAEKILLQIHTLLHTQDTNSAP